MNGKSIVIGLVALVLGPFVWCQQTLGTLYANTQMNVALFFPSPIKQAITGHQNAVFSYNREEGQYLGLLQAMAGTDTNLFVVTMDGYAYEFKVAYADRLSRTHVFLDRKHSLGRMGPLPRVKSGPSVKDRTPLSFMETLLRDHKGANLGTVRRGGIRLRLAKRVYKGNDMYLVFELRNRSGIDYDLAILDILRVNGSQKSKTSYQETRLVPHFTFQQPGTLKSGSTYRFVQGYPKYVVGANERLKMILIESQGGRRLELVVD